jgi:TRAP-type C4-dicarboxylate transport system permease small subunit
MQMTPARRVYGRYVSRVRWVVGALAVAAGAAVAAMILVTCADVVGRRFGCPLKGTYDIVELLGAVTVTGALPYTTACRGHVAIERFVQKLPLFGRILVGTAMRVISFFMFAFLTFRFVLYGRELRASGQVTLTLQWPIFWMPYWMALRSGAMVLPGILMAVLFGLAIYIQCVRRPELGPAALSCSWGAKILSLRGAWETLLLFIAVMGGMFLGYFTPTEAAAIGAAGVIIITAIKRQLGFRILVRSLTEILRTSVMVMIIVAGAVVFRRFLAITRIPTGMATWLAGLPLPGWGIMMLIVLFYLVAGCFVDALALVLLTIPILAPMVTNLGFDPIWFGVMIVLVTRMGVIAPPVGVCVYVVSGIEREVPPETIFRGALPFLAALVIAAILLITFPQLCLFLPNLVH